MAASRRNPKLRAFVEEVRSIVNDNPAERRPITKTNAVAAADFIDARLNAASKGGQVARKPKTGRPITDKTQSGALNRERVRRHRAAKKSAE